MRTQVYEAPDGAKPRLDGVDALRGAAALAVVLFHSMLALYAGVLALHARTGSLDRITSYLSWPIHYGYVGVMLFFVLSGFVIHLPYAAGKRRFVFGSYLARRTLRIYPPYLAALALSVLVATHVRDAHVPPLDARVALKAAFFLQNYPHWGGAGGEYAWLQPAGNLSLWSLPVEFELYLAYPLLLLLMRRFSLTNTMLVVCGISLAASFVEIFIAHPAAGSNSRPNLANYLPSFLHYWIVWCAGAWLAERYARRTMPVWNVRWTLAFAASVLLALANRLPVLPNDISDYVLMVVFVCAIVRLASLGLLAGAGSANPLVRLGDMSYSLYLVHMPIFIVMAAAWTHSHGGALPANYLLSVVAVLVVIPIAYVFSVVFERPSIVLAARAGRAFDRRAPNTAFAQVATELRITAPAGNQAVE